jgi:hypothetical protein
MWLSISTLTHACVEWCHYEAQRQILIHVKFGLCLVPWKTFPSGATQPIVGVYLTALYRTLASSCTRLLDHTQRRATFGRTPLNE